mmetsp:Transcript_65587/g.125097  ORF Transcript_65587/g.125097 Transcript_65587/m.125097 type:complete len:96 (-) Transcript_65587:66-353(-)
MSPKEPQTGPESIPKKALQKAAMPIQRAAFARASVQASLPSVPGHASIEKGCPVTKAAAAMMGFSVTNIAAPEIAKKLIAQKCKLRFHVLAGCET